MPQLCGIAGEKAIKLLAFRRIWSKGISIRMHAALNSGKGLMIFKKIIG
jgi:hypothetical protein